MKSKKNPFQSLVLFARAICFTLAIAILFALSRLEPACARYVTPADLVAVNELERAEVEVDADGLYRVTIERLIRVTSDEGRDRESIQSIDFNDSSSDLSILQAETINGEQKLAVEKKNIEIKPVGDSSRYFDTIKRAKISFPQVKVGSRLRLKYRIDVKEIPNAGFYSFMADFNWWYLESYDLTIRSRLKLFNWKNDPESVLDIKSSTEGKFHVLRVKSKRPIVRLTTQEESPYIRAERSLSFAVRTLDDWSKYAGLTIARQEALLEHRLPPSMERIREAALKEPDAVSKLDRISALLSQEYRYFGDWRHRNGGFIPRPLDEIHATRYGDCKDLSLSMVAILRSIGIKADIAWTVRGEPHLRPNRDAYQMPLDWFNHAITRVEVDGKIYWVDPTNPVAQSRFVPYDISGKPAFVLNREKPFLDMIPELNSQTSEREWSYIYELGRDRKFKVQGLLKLSGRAAIYQSTNLALRPVDAVKYDLLRVLSYGHKMTDSWIGDLPTGSRIVRDIEVPFRFSISDGGVKTSAGYGFLLNRESVVEKLLEETKARVSDLYLDTPVVWKTREELVGVRRLGRQNLDCDLANEWVHLTRKVSDTSNGVAVNDRVEIIKGVIPNEALLSPEFEAFQTRLRECFFRVSVIYEPASAPEP